jgi:uncharacterized protein
MPAQLALVALIALAALAALGAIAAALIGLIAYRGMIRYRIKDARSIAESSLASGRMAPGFLSLPWAEADIPSPLGYPIRARALRGPEPRLALFHHGIGWNWTGMARCMELFRARGWTVVAFDSRGHGDSGGGRPSYGILESRDMKAVADWALGRFPASGGFVALGESMGAATALMYAALDPRLDAAVADCPYSSALGELKHRLARAWVAPGLRELAIRAADAVCVARQGFSLGDAEPARAILETEVPVMLIHGLEDDYVPWRMSVVMAETRRRRLPAALTELLLVPGARHGGSIGADPEGYERALFGFIEESLARAGKLDQNYK